MQQPDVFDIIDVKPIVQFQSSEILCASCSNLSGDINPQALDPYIVHTPGVSIRNLQWD